MMEGRKKRREEAEGGKEGRKKGSYSLLFIWLSSQGFGK
jgi:hypothetical protein